jgi:CheY-like chemotaxis protein
MKPQQNINVLVIDDDSAQYELIEAILSNNGYSVLTAESAKRGLELFDRYHPSVIISDFSMPDMDGAELIEQLKTERGWDVPVVIVSSHPPDYIRQQMRPNSYPDAILPKPIDVGQLLITIGVFYQNYCQSHRCHVS